jgi:hypothetical protein
MIVKNFIKSFILSLLLITLMTSCQGSGTETGNPNFRDNADDKGFIGSRPDGGSEFNPQNPEANGDDSSEDNDNSLDDPNDENQESSDDIDEAVFSENNFCDDFEDVCDAGNFSSGDFIIINQDLISSNDSFQVRSIKSDDQKTTLENYLDIEIPEINFDNHQLIYLEKNIENRYFSFFLAYYWEDSKHLHLVIQERKYDCEIFDDRRSFFDLVQISQINLPIEIHYLSEIIACNNN